MTDKNIPGLVHIYSGDGKGKTTAALGLAVRAAGRGKRVLIVRFLKTDDSGEIIPLSQIPGIDVMACEKTFGFVFQMDEEKKKQAAKYYQQQFFKAAKQAEEGSYDMFIMDEIMAAVSSGMVKEEYVISFLENKPSALEIVMTGRNPSVRLLELADYVTEMKMVRHPYTRGISAREGIEY